jgi:flavin reductase (DIM6/NTAB) family NADH-FMN oxidoreductase RutF
LKQIPRLALKPELSYRLFYPQVPTILCARSKELSAMPVVSAIPISNSPTKIAVSVKIGLKTNHVLKKSSAFSLNWLDFKNRSVVSKLSRIRAKRTNDKLRSLKIPYEMVLGAPVLDASIAYAILEREKVIDVGDHDLFIGRVTGAMASLDFDEYWKFNDYRPVLYLGSTKRKSFATL